MYGSVLVTTTIEAEYGKGLPTYGTLLRGVVDPGEASALALALEVQGPLLILDDRKARSVAKKAGIPLTGTLGAILEAKNRSIVSEVAPIFERLSKVGSWIADDLRSHLLKLAGEV